MRVVLALAVTLAILPALSGCGKSEQQIVYIDSETGEEVPPPSQAQPDEAAEPEEVEADQPAASEETRPEPPAPGSRPTSQDRPVEQPALQPPQATSTPEPGPTEPPAPTPTPTPAPVEVTLAAGTLLTVEFEEKLSSHESEVGQAFTARVVDPVEAAERTLVPVGSRVRGTVVEARPAKKIGGRARLSLDFETLELPSGEEYPLHAVFSEKGRSSTGKDAAIIGGATVGGAILGHQVDDDKGKEIGALVGAIAGAIATSRTAAEPVELPEGTVMTLELIEPVTVVYRP